ncbi:MAG: RodZ domain-containing protein [Alphaproteobacteria bacterium]
MASSERHSARTTDERATHLREVDGGESGVAADLVQARLHYGIDLQDVAENLRIRYDHLRALEEGRFDDLPGPTYAVGFLRSYATYLGLDAENLVERFKDEAADFSARQKLHFPSPVEDGRLPTSGLLFVALMIAGAAYTGWYYVNSLDEVAVDRVPEVPARLAERVSGTESTANPSEAPPAAVIATPSEPVATPDTAMTEPGEPAAPPLSAGVDEGADDAAAAPVAEVADAPVPVPPAAETAAPSVATAGDSATEAESTAGEPAGAGDFAPAPEPLATAFSTEPLQTVGPATTPLEPAIAPPSLGEAESARQGVAAPAARAAALRAARPAAGEPPTANAPASVTEIRTAALAHGNAPAPVTETRTAALAPESAPAPAAEPEPNADAPVVPPPVTEAPDYVPRVFGQAHVGSRIRVRAAEEAWVQITGLDNELLLTRILRPGDVYNVPDRQGLTLMTGNAGGLEIFVDDVPAPPLGPVGAVRRDVALDPASLLRGASREP